MRRATPLGVVLALAVLGGCASPRPFTPALGVHMPVPLAPAPLPATPAARAGGVVSVPGPAPAALPRAAMPEPERGPVSTGADTRLRVEGVVERVDGETAVVRIAADRTVLIDFSEMVLSPPPVLAPGRSIAVWGDWRPTALVARGVAFDYGGDR